MLYRIWALQLAALRVQVGWGGGYRSFGDLSLGLGKLFRHGGGRRSEVLSRESLGFYYWESLAPHKSPKCKTSEIS